MNDNWLSGESLRRAEEAYRYDESDEIVDEIYRLLTPIIEKSDDGYCYRIENEDEEQLSEGCCYPTEESAEEAADEKRLNIANYLAKHGEY